VEIKKDDSLRAWVFLPPILAVIVLLLKILAWRVTGSLAFKVDALESLVNVSASLLASVLISWSRQPPDEGHPWGHGKFEYLISLFEGVSLAIAAFWVLNDALTHLQEAGEQLRLDPRGLWLQVVAAAINFGSGLFFISLSKRKHSPALYAQGLHWLTDVGTSIAGLVGMGLVKWTGESRWDLAVGLLMAVWLLKVSYTCLRPAIQALMDQEDEVLLQELSDAMTHEELPNELISIHDTKCRNFGSYAQVEWHVVLPEYLTVKQAHEIVDDVEMRLQKKLKTQTGRSVFFVSHIDPCLQRECEVCSIAECSVRRFPKDGRFLPTLENLRKMKDT
jgi:cation diffusion facilitator family transporter